MHTLEFATRIIAIIDDIETCDTKKLAVIREFCRREIAIGRLRVDSDVYDDVSRTAVLCAVEESVRVVPVSHGNACVVRLNADLAPKLFIGKDVGDCYRIWRVA